jgi:hypothetical protein
MNTTVDIVPTLKDCFTNSPLRLTIPDRNLHEEKQESEQEVAQKQEWRTRVWVEEMHKTCRDTLSHLVDESGTIPLEQERRD